jgi:hypothetical protein
MKAKFIGSTEFATYPNLIEGKTYEVYVSTIDEDGEKWVLLKNEDGNEVNYNAKFFKII